ncbi:MAG TPA: hypothetical protein VFY36_10585 [Solirubrobacteraceae bacterium]|nr:hypothetical protein [Solirubrobacteraceae bacterium]
MIGVLAWPLLFTYSGFAGDWMHHLWFMWHQSLSIQSGHVPSFFLNTSYSVFNPIFAFYGGTLYTVTGTLSLALGEAPMQAYILVYVLDFAAVLGGWYWLGRMAGLSRWLALVPGLIFATSAYYLAVAYVLGDWPEFTGVSMIPLMVAAGLSVLRADRLRIGAAIALTVSSILFFGSHNITIMLGLTTLAIAGLAIVVCVPDARRQITWRGSARVAGVVVPAALVSAWYLLPAIIYASRTRLGREYAHVHESLHATSKLVAFEHLFTLSRASALATPSPYPFAVSLPLLAIAWVLAGILILPWGGSNRMWRRLLLVCMGVASLVIVAMTHVGVLLALPRQYTLIQFSYRLESYVLLALCAAVLVALVLARGSERRLRIWTWLAIPVCAVSLIGAIQQLRGFPYPGQDRYTALDSYAEDSAGNNEDYQDPSAPILPRRKLKTLEFPPSTVYNDRVSVSVRMRPGTLVATNIAAGSYLLEVTGAKPVGVDSENDDLVLSIGDGGERHADEAGAPTQPIPEETISVGTGNSLPIVLGRLLTLSGLAILALELLLLPACRLFVARRANHRRVVATTDQHRIKAG